MPLGYGEAQVSSGKGWQRMALLSGDSYYHFCGHCCVHSPARHLQAAEPSSCL